MRRFTLFCDSGLANRIQVLVSGRVIARAAGAELEFLWPLYPTCNCAFERLFLPSPDVRTVPHEAVVALPTVRRMWGAQPPDLIAETGDLTMGYVAWWVQPQHYPHHAPLWDELGPGLEALLPAPEINERVAAFEAASFRDKMIGVHLRRGDFNTARPDVIDNIDAVSARVAEHLVTWPDAGIFLATDDGAKGGGRLGPMREGVRQQLERRFGSRVMGTAPRSLDRNSPEAIEDALVELLLLRKTHAVVGTAGSSFSSLAAFGRDVLFDRPDGTPLRWRRAEAWSDKIGATPHIYAAARRYLGYEPSNFYHAWRAMRFAIGESRAVMTLRAITGIKRRG